MRNLAICTIVLVAVTSQPIASGGDRKLSYFRSDNVVAMHGKDPLPGHLDSSHLAWRQSLGNGCSTPCVTSKHVFVTEFKHKHLSTIAFDMATGSILWTQTAPTNQVEPFHPTDSPATASPATDGNRLFVFFGSYGMLCYDLAGRLVWSRPLKPFQDEWGAASSPILVDDKVILNQDHDSGSFLVALSQDTGDVVWKTQRERFTRSYATPVVWEQNSSRLVLVAGATELIAYNVDDGRPYWWIGGLSRIVNPTPTKGRDVVYIASWSP